VNTPGRPEVASIDLRMYSLTVAASAAVTDLSDVAVRGYLKEHPAVVAYRLDLLEQMIAVVRDRARAEDLTWRRRDVQEGLAIPDPAAEHAGRVTEFSEHDCSCDWCLRGGEERSIDLPALFVAIRHAIVSAPSRGEAVDMVASLLEVPPEV